MREGAKPPQPKSMERTRRIRPSLHGRILEFRHADPDRLPECARRSEAGRDLALNLVHCEHHEQYDSQDEHERQRAHHREMAKDSSCLVFGDS